MMMMMIFFDPPTLSVSNQVHEELLFPTVQRQCSIKKRRWNTPPASPVPGRPPKAQQQSVWLRRLHTATQAVVLTPSPLLPQHAASESSTGGMSPRATIRGSPINPPSSISSVTSPNMPRIVVVVSLYLGCPRRQFGPKRLAAARSIVSHLTDPNAILRS